MPYFGTIATILAFQMIFEGLLSFADSARRKTGKKCDFNDIVNYFGENAIFASVHEVMRSATSQKNQRFCQKVRILYTP